MLKPGNGKTHLAYLWSWCLTQYDDIKAVVYDFAETRGGRHARGFVGDWKGKLVCDDYAGYKALFETGITEAGCMAYARRKVHDRWANHSSQIAGEALALAISQDDKVFIHPDHPSIDQVAQAFTDSGQMSDLVDLARAQAKLPIAEAFPAYANAENKPGCGGRLTAIEIHRDGMNITSSVRL